MATTRHEKSIAYGAAVLCGWRVLSALDLWHQADVGAAIVVTFAGAVGILLAIWDAVRPAVDLDRASAIERFGWNSRINGAAFCFFLAHTIITFGESAGFRTRLMAAIGLSATIAIAFAMWLERPRTASE